MRPAFSFVTHSSHGSALVVTHALSVAPASRPNSIIPALYAWLSSVCTITLSLYSEKSGRTLRMVSTMP